jgi:type II secretory pathway pseudopilin PulG
MIILQDGRPFEPKEILGFSLVEISIALGIMAFALVGIMALFPLAMRSSQESQHETRATFIAKQIYADFAASASPTNTFIATGTNLANPAHRLSPFSLAANSTNAILYDEEGNPLGPLTPAAAFETNVPMNLWPTAVYATRIIVSTNNLPPGLSRVEVLVSAPAAASLSNRARFLFVTLLRNQ